VPHKFATTKQAAFIKKYKALKVQVTDEPIVYIDVSHTRQATKLSNGWIKKVMIRYIDYFLLNTVIPQHLLVLT
jgi:NAD(P)H-dependent flavin oxidoreductase YrpB (nitropropane dioxygenase family)